MQTVHSHPIGREPQARGHGFCGSCGVLGVVCGQWWLQVWGWGREPRGKSAGRSQPGGLPAISRWWRAATPPEPGRTRTNLPATRRVASQAATGSCWHPCRDAASAWRGLATCNRWCRSFLAPPPANGCDACGIVSASPAAHASAGSTAGFVPLPPFTWDGCANGHSLGRPAFLRSRYARINSGRLSHLSSACSRSASADISSRSLTVSTSSHASWKRGKYLSGSVCTFFINCTRKSFGMGGAAVMASSLCVFWAFSNPFYCPLAR